MAYYFKSWERRRNTKRAKLLNFLLAHPCIDCGENDLRVLDFDHLSPEKKIGNVSALAYRGNNSWKKIEAEIIKCEVRCANCHRKKTIGKPLWFSNPQLFIKNAEDAEQERKNVKIELGKIIHGTRSGYLKEVRRKMKTCDVCRKINAIYTKEQYYKLKFTPMV